MHPLLEIVVFSFVATLMAVLAIYRTTYRVTESHLVIRVFGVPIRRIALQRIRRYVRERDALAELWVNRLMPGRRTLIIELKDGLFRQIVISPRLPDVFRHELSEARRALKCVPIEESVSIPVPQPN